MFFFAKLWVSAVTEAVASLRRFRPTVLAFAAKRRRCRSANHDDRPIVLNNARFSIYDIFSVDDFNQAVRNSHDLCLVA